LQSGRSDRRNPVPPQRWHFRVAFANSRRAPGTVIITHTETPRALRGRGIASELVQGALQLIRADSSKVVAGCGFVVDYLHRHPEFSDLVR
jgi:predicted GNAT family acetyltransferase